MDGDSALHNAVLSKFCNGRNLEQLNNEARLLMSSGKELPFQEKTEITRLAE